MKMVTKQAGTTGRCWWLGLDKGLILLQLSKARREYYTLKKSRRSIRSTEIEAREKKQAVAGNMTEEARLNALITTEKSRERAKRMKSLKPKGRGVGVTKPTVPDTTEKDGATRDITGKDALERNSHKEI
mmetsp:Transcript_53808/g.161031  ORF Transcript_53808/g.161031 Transcript_53808/m.161031 type:complete len:130 (-) Transcript_53808:3072-3461(-)